MRTPSTILESNHPVLAESKLSDIAPIFNLIQAGSLNGNFSNLYAQPRYMAGLGIQLFSLWMGGKIRLPDGIWYRASMQVLRVGRNFAGFVILRHEVEQPDVVEIYMCGIANEFRGKGLGEWMIRAALSEVPSNCKLIAECLPNSVQMQALLMKLGFTRTTQPTPRRNPGAPQTLMFSRRADTCCASQ